MRHCCFRVVSSNNDTAAGLAKRKTGDGEAEAKCQQPQAHPSVTPKRQRKPSLVAQCSDDVSGPVAHTPAIGPAGLPRTARVAAKREEIGFGINSSVSVRWGKATAAAWLDAIVVAFEPEGPRPVHVCFEIDDNYAWVPMVHVKPHADAEPSSVPEGLQVGCLIEVQDPHCKLDPDQWHSGKVENVKQTAAGAVQTGLLFWVQFMGDRTNQWCRLRHVRPQPTSGHQVNQTSSKTTFQY